MADPGGPAAPLRGLAVGGDAQGGRAAGEGGEGRGLVGGSRLAARRAVRAVQEPFAGQHHGGLLGARCKCCRQGGEAVGRPLVAGGQESHGVAVDVLEGAVEDGSRGEVRAGQAQQVDGRPAGAEPVPGAVGRSLVEHQDARWRCGLRGEAGEAARQGRTLVAGGENDRELHHCFRAAQPRRRWPEWERASASRAAVERM